MAEQLSFEITVDSASGSANLRRFRGEVEATHGSVRKLVGGFSDIGRKLLELNAVTELAEKAFHGIEGLFRRFIEPVVESGNELLNLSRRFGTTVTQM